LTQLRRERRVELVPVRAVGRVLLERDDAARRPHRPQVLVVEDEARFVVVALRARGTSLRRRRRAVLREKQRIEQQPAPALVAVDDPRVVVETLGPRLAERAEGDAHDVAGESGGEEQRREQEREVLAVAAPGVERLVGEEPRLRRAVLLRVRDVRSEVRRHGAYAQIERARLAGAEQRLLGGREARDDVVERVVQDRVARRRQELADVDAVAPLRRRVRPPRADRRVGHDQVAAPVPAVDGTHVRGAKTHRGLRFSGARVAGARPGR
jgi:predicted RNase H-like nuclease